MTENEVKIEKSVGVNIVEIIEYAPNSVVVKNILNKCTGYITAMSFDTGEELGKRSSPFDTFIQIIDGIAEIVIDGKSTPLEKGQSIIIPAHSAYNLKANERFKMTLTVIKSGYE